MQPEPKTLKIPAPLHAELKHLASTPPGEPINELGARFISQGIAATKAKNARKAKKEAAK